MSTYAKTKECKECKATLRVCLRDKDSESFICNATISVFEWKSYESGGTGGTWRPLAIKPQATRENGCVEFELQGGASHEYGVAFKNALGFYKEPGASFGEAPGIGSQEEEPFTIDCNCTRQIDFEIPAKVSLEVLICGPKSEIYPCQDIAAGQAALVRASHDAALCNLSINFFSDQGSISQHRTFVDGGKQVYEASLNTLGMEGPYVISASFRNSDGSSTTASSAGLARKDVLNVDARTTTSLTRTETEPTDDLPLWVAIRNSTEALSFNNYLRFMDFLFCGKDDRSSLKEFERGRFNMQDGKVDTYQKLRDKRSLPFTDADAYRVVKAATEAFVMVNCGILRQPRPFTRVGVDRNLDEAYLDRRDIPVPGRGLGQVFNADYLETVDGGTRDPTSTLPYLAIIRRKLPDVTIKTTLFEDNVVQREADECFGFLQEKLANPCLLELIWSYWHEEGMLVQTVNAITRRFQNVRAPTPQDPLSNLEMDPLRPLNNLFWGYIQDEQHRLTVARRHYEYDHHYGLRLEGKAVQNFQPADTRSKFLEAFHHLLRLCTVFYKQDDDTTIKADAFPVLNALKEVHLILSQGAHNQFGDMPSTARIEMLMQEWLLARPEFREYLPTRIMVAYPEPWMDRVDAMKKLQDWTDTSVLHFRNLGIFGEQLLLSIRWGAWSDVQEPTQAFNWARFFRPQGQGYIHAYRSVTGVDLSADPSVDTRVDSTLPSVLLQKRLASQRRAS
jgi:hypothetical protein